MKKYLCWHFLQDNKRLRWGNQAVVKTGRTYRATGPLVLCENGMHGSEEILDALSYAPGSTICRVEIWGGVKRDDDKLVGRYRKVLKMVDGEEILREFARICALRVVRKYWKAAPKIVIRYLETGDESIQEAARAAAWNTAGDAARAAAWDAARAAARAAALNTAGDAARAAARAAAWDAALTAAWDAARAAVWNAAGDAARAAAWDAARAAQNRLLRIMVTRHD